MKTGHADMFPQLFYLLVALVACGNGWDMMGYIGIKAPVGFYRSNPTRWGTSEPL